MKKVFKSLLLLLAFVFICQSGIFAADTEYLVPDKKMTDRLVAFDVIDNVEINGNEAITKAEFAELALRSAGFGKPWAVTAESGFADVPETHDYYHAILAAKGAGIAKGDETGRFNPDSTITTVQAITMAFRAISGYANMAELKGGYPNGYITVAADYGILKNITMSNEITKNDALKLIDNLLDADVLTAQYANGEIGSFTDEGGKTNLERIFGVTERRADVKNVDIATGKVTVVFNNGGMAEYVLNDKTLASKLGGRITLYIDNMDDTRVVYAETTAATDVMYDFIFEINKSSVRKPLRVKDIKYVYLTNADKVYKTSENLDIYYNDKKVDIAANDYVGCFVKAVISEDTIIRMDIYKLNEGGLLYRADKDEIRFTQGEVYENKVKGFEEVEDLQVYIDGELVDDIRDLKIDMVFDYWTNGMEKCIIVASSRRVIGTVEGYTDTHITISGEEFALSKDPGFYNFHVQDNSYRKGGDYTYIMNQPVEMFIDDSKYVRYIRVDTSKSSKNVFCGVLDAVAEAPIGGNAEISVFKVIQGGVERAVLKVKDKLLAGSYSLDYLKTIQKNLDGLGFLKFTVNDDQEVVKIEKVPYYGDTPPIERSEWEYFAENRLVGDMYVGEATFIAIYEQDGEFTVKVPSYDNELMWAYPRSRLTVTSDYSVRYNPAPDYVVLTKGIEGIRDGSRSTGLITELKRKADDKVTLVMDNGKQFEVDTEFVNKHGLKENMIILYYGRCIGKYPLYIEETPDAVRDFSGDSSTWDVDEFTSESTNGFFKADKVLYRNDYVIQFEIDGEPTDVYKFHDNTFSGTSLKVYELAGRKLKVAPTVSEVGQYAEYVRSTQKYPVMNIQQGDNVWFHVAIVEGRRTIDYMVYENTGAFFKKGE